MLTALTKFHQRALHAKILTVQLQFVNQNKLTAHHRHELTAAHLRQHLKSRLMSLRKLTLLRQCKKSQKFTRLRRLHVQTMAVDIQPLAFVWSMNARLGNTTVTATQNA
jgi:hypothetical protein